MTVHFGKVAIIGVGLIGGSLAMVMREKGLTGSIVGIGRGVENLKTAKELGVVDAYTTDVTEGVKGADLVVLATPVGTTLSVAEKMVPYLKKGTIITDVGSVKEEIVTSIEGLIPSHLHFVGGHPVAGTERSGVKAAFLTLYKNRKCILTPTERTDPGALEKIKLLWEAAGSEVVIMEPRSHDRILSIVSHLPHIVAYALVNTLVDMEGSHKILNYCAGGFKDFTRIASSSPEMWRDISVQNRERILEAITLFQETIDRLKKLIDEGDGRKTLKEFQKAKKVKEIID